MSPLSGNMIFILSLTDIDNLFDVKSELTSEARNWKNIGLALRLKHSQLSSIEAKGLDNNEYLTDMLELWLKKTYDVDKYGEPSWRVLREAVRNPAGGNNPALADRIAQTD